MLKYYYVLQHLPHLNMKYFMMTLIIIQTLFYLISLLSLSPTTYLVNLNVNCPQIFLIDKVSLIDTFYGILNRQRQFFFLGWYFISLSIAFSFKSYLENNDILLNLIEIPPFFSKIIFKKCIK